MNRITFSNIDDWDGNEKTREISFDFDGTMVQFAESVREFASALGFYEETINKFIADPHDTL